MLCRIVTLKNWPITYYILSVGRATVLYNDVVNLPMRGGGGGGGGVG